MIDWNPVLLAFIAFLGVLATGVVSIYLAKINKTANKTHMLANSQSLLQLRLYADTVRQLAIAVPGDTAINARAAAAEKMVKDREMEQDKMGGNPT